MDLDGTVQKVAKFIDVWYYGDGARAIHRDSRDASERLLSEIVFGEENEFE